MNGIWILLLITSVLIPVIMIGSGYLFLKKTPKNINGIYGYRTHRSMKNLDTWTYAHHHFGRNSVLVGCIVLILSLFVMVILFDKEKVTIGIYGSILIMIQVFVLILLIVPTEIALRNTFDKNGNYILKDMN